MIFRFIQAWNHPNQILLHFGRQRRRKAVEINLVCVVSFGLQKKLVSRLIGKLYNLVFY